MVSNVDANHAGNMENRRSRFGIIVYANNAPIIWYSKLQNTVEASSFGSEFSALSISTEIIESLRYKLICFWISVERPAELFFDIMSVVNNSSIPTSALNKGNNSIYYHSIREAQDIGILLIWVVTGEFNLSYLFTKTTIPWNKMHNLVGSIFSNKASPIGDIEKA